MLTNVAFVVLVDVAESLLQHFFFFHVYYCGSEELIVSDLSVFVDIHGVMPFQFLHGPWRCLETRRQV